MKAAGWDRVDLDMLASWNFADLDRFSADKLRTVLQASVPPRWQGWQFTLSLIDRIQRNDPYLTTLFVAGLAILVLMGGGWRARLVPLFCLGIAAGITTLLLVYSHAPHRVYFPAFSAVLAVAIVHASSSCTTRQWKWLTLSETISLTLSVTLAACFRQRRLVLEVAAVLLVISRLAWQTNQFFQEKTSREIRRQDAESFMATLCENPANLYVIWAQEFPYEELILPLEAPPRFENFKAIPLGWSYVTPLTANRLKEYGITEFYQALYQRDNLFLISSRANGKLLARYLFVHYGVHIAEKPVCVFPSKIEIVCWAAVVTR